MSAISARSVPGRLAPRSLMLALAGLAALAGCQASSGHPQPPPPPQTPFDAWRHRPGAGTFVEPGALVETQPAAGLFTLAADGAAPPLVVSGQEWAGVRRAAGDLRTDVEKVTGILPGLATDTPPDGEPELVLVGTLGRAPLVDALVAAGRIDVSQVAGRWETFVLQVVEAPMPGVTRALVIAGSDQRGTIYGLYELSRQMGVSPWYYWDDVPIAHRAALYVHPEPYTLGTPAVKYRGIFINDENPQLGNWVPRTFGNGLAPGFPYGFNHQFYAKVFETMLRLRANYLWPAVWGRAFAEDDPENHATATLYGVVMGTSHEAPMMRGIEEWNRHASSTSDPYGGNGEWRFSTNRDAVVAYMRDGIQRMKDEGFEGVVTLGMRGPGDIALPAEDGIPIVQDVISTQRQILQDVMGGDIREIPQVWTLYSEVLDWYLSPEGIQVPDDVTIVWAEDNWGSFKKLPSQYVASERAGGYGLYYHLDFVGGPRCYKWVDSTLLENAWEQLDLAYGYGVDRVWMVNVGDLKDVEVPTEFFLDYAWAPERWPVTRIPEWLERWAAEQFGPAHAAEIAGVYHRYQQLQSDRKPELLNRVHTIDQTVAAAPVTAIDGDPFSLTSYREHERVTAQWIQLAADSSAIAGALPAEQQDAYFELVDYAVQASANAYRLRLAQFQNLLYAAQGRAAAPARAAEANARFADDAALSARYDTVAGGKWLGWANQSHFGYGLYSSWQEPENSSGQPLPDFIWPALAAFTVPAAAGMGVALDGSDRWWPNETAAQPVLPTFGRYQAQPGQWIEVFNRGTTSFTFTAAVPAEYAGLVQVSPASGTVEEQVRLSVSADPAAAGAGVTEVPITLTGSEGTTVVVTARVDGAAVPASFQGFVEANGYVSVEAEHASAAVGQGTVGWFRIPGIGRTGAAMAVLPRNAAVVASPGGSTPHLEYPIYLLGGGTRTVDVWTYLSPRNSVRIASGALDGLTYAVSLDGEAPQVVNATQRLHIDPQANRGIGNSQWEWKTANAVLAVRSTHTVTGAGPHVLRYWLVDPTAVVQRFVIDTGGLLPSYLGPPESRCLGGAFCPGD